MGNGKEVERGTFQIRELEKYSREGTLFVAEEDVVESTRMLLIPGSGGDTGGKQMLQPIQIPPEWMQILGPKHFDFFVSIKSSIGQLGGNIRYRSSHRPKDGLLRTEFVNESLHVIRAESPYNLGRLIAKGSPLTDEPFKDALNEFKIDGEFDRDTKRGRLILPVVEEYEQAEIDYDEEIDLSALPTGSKRDDLHKHLNIEKKGHTGPGFERPQELGMTIPIKVPAGKCIWIIGCEDETGSFVTHGESRALYGGYDKWGIVTETHKRVVGGKLIAEVYNSYEIPMAM